MNSLIDVSSSANQLATLILACMYMSIITNSSRCINLTTIHYNFKSSLMSKIELNLKKKKIKAISKCSLFFIDSLKRSIDFDQIVEPLTLIFPF